MAKRELKISYYKDKADGAEYRLGETAVGEQWTKVWIRPLNTNKSWIDVGTFKGSATKIKREIKYRVGTYFFIEAEQLDYDY